MSGLFLLISCGVATPLLLAGSSGSSRPAARIPDALRPLLVLSVVGVFLADNVFVFLMLWEVSALVIYALVAVRYQEEDASRAAELTLTLTKLGGAAVLAGFLLLAATAGSFSFAALTTLGPAQDAALRGVCFLLFFVGFGVKAAIVPVQTWLPRAYGQSTAESAGLLAAVALNLAFYGMLRTWFDLLGDPAVWWAVVALLAGSVTALLGILGGIVQGRLREFIAYSSIENAGIIVTALGVALMGSAEHQSGLLGLGLVAATFQITAHSVAKAGLFTAAAAVERSAGTDDMDRLGGLYRVLPVASVGALFGAAALSALPPFSGFASEWMTFEGLMQGFRVGGTGAHLAMALAGALLALTAGLDGAGLRPGDRDHLPRLAQRARTPATARSQASLDRRWGAGRGLAGDRDRRALGRRGAGAGDGRHRRRCCLWHDRQARLADRAWLSRLRQHLADRAGNPAGRLWGRVLGPPGPASRSGARPRRSGLGLGDGARALARAVLGLRLREHEPGHLQRDLPDPAAG